MGSGGGKSGKAGGGGGSKDYYGDIAGVVCLGPVDALMSIQKDGTEIWNGGPSGLARAGQPNPVPISIEGQGTLWLYWGEADQVLDPIGEALLATGAGAVTKTKGEKPVNEADDPAAHGGHPPYRNLCVAVLRKFLFGQERQAAPNVELVVRRKPRQSLITGAAAELDADGQANPLCVIAEILTNPAFGLGLADDRFEATSWQTAADALYVVADKTYISPVLTSSKAVRALLDDLRQYYDGFFRYTELGLIAAGRWAHGDAPPAFTAANTITAADLVDEADISASGWDDTTNEVKVTFADAATAFKDNTAVARSTYNRGITGEPRVDDVELPHVTRAAQAGSFAAEKIKLVEVPLFTGTLKVRGVKAASNPVGGLFRFVHDLLGIDLIARVVARELAPPPSETATIEFQAERGLSIVTLPSIGSGADYAPPAEFEVIRGRLVQPPAALFGDNYRLVSLVRRLDPYTVAVKVWFQQADVAQFQDLGTITGFGVVGKLAQAYAATAGTPDDDSETLQIVWAQAPIDNDLELLSEAQTDDQMADNTILAFIFAPSDPRLYEIVTVRGLRFDGGVVYARVRRARFGMVARDFPADAEIWLVRRRDLVAGTHDSFPALSRAQAVATFRLQSISPFGSGDLTNTDQCPDIPYTFKEVYPTDVISFALDGSRLSWLTVGDLYIAGYRIRYQPGTRRTWSDAIPLHQGLLTDSPYTMAVRPTGAVTIMIKAVDISDSESENVAAIVTDLGDAPTANIIGTYDEQARAWPGTLTGGTVDGGTNQLIANSNTLMWSVNPAAPMWATDGATLMWNPTTYGAMSYTTRMEIAGVLPGSTVTLNAEIIGDPWAVFYSDASGSRMWAIDDSTPMWAADDSAPMWTPPTWKPWPGVLAVLGDLSLDFLITTGEAITQGRVNTFIALLDAPDVSEEINDLVTAAGGTRLPITKSYRVIKTVQLTVQADGNGAITARTEDKSATLGPLVKAFNSSGTAVIGFLDATVRGY